MPFTSRGRLGTGSGQKRTASPLRAPRSASGGRAASLARGLAVLGICGSQMGCMVMRLASRGPPEQEMRELAIDVAPVDLPAAVEVLPPLYG